MIETSLIGPPFIYRCDWCGNRMTEKQVGRSLMNPSSYPKIYDSWECHFIDSFCILYDVTYIPAKLDYREVMNEG